MDSTGSLEDDITRWVAIDNGRQIVFASFTLIIYEYFITLDQEVKFFWTGKWTPSRILYLGNRYLPPVIMALLVVCFNAKVSLEFCDHTIRLIFGLSTVALFVIQGILVLRVLYMFKHSNIARFFIIATYSSAIVGSITLLILVLLNRSFITPLSVLGERVNLVGCPVHSLTKFWYLYIPAFSLHTTLYVFTLIRVLSCSDSPEALLIRRLHRDGGLFYLVVVAVVGYTEIGSALVQDPETNIPAIFAGFLLAATSISISRVMLSFHNLAEYLKNDPNRLGSVNNIQLKKVNWTKGSHDGEFLVMRPDPNPPSNTQSPPSGWGAGGWVASEAGAIPQSSIVTK